MNFPQLQTLSILLILMSCEVIPDKNDAVATTEIHSAGLVDSTGISAVGTVNESFFESIRANFLYQNIEYFTFTEGGTFNHKIDKLPKVDATLKAKILKCLNQTNWSDYCELSYFSSHKIAETEYGVFLSKREFDGLTFDFVMLQFHDDGSILFCDLLASWSEAAGCVFYTNAHITNKKIKTLYVEKCYDFELDARITKDSTELHFELTSQGFKEIRKVRLK